MQSLTVEELFLENISNSHIRIYSQIICYAVVLKVLKF